MKIVYFCNFIGTSGGLDRIVIAKANYLSQKHDVFIVTTNQQEKKYFYPLDAKVKHIDFSEYGRVRPLWFEKQKFHKIMNDINPDIIISPTGKESLVLPFFDHSIPKIKEMHFSRYHRTLNMQNKNFLKKILIKMMDKIELKVFSKYDKLIPLTYEDQKQWDLNNTEVIYNFKSFESKHIASLDSKVVISVGRLEYQKGFDMLIQAWKKVCQHDDAWMLHIYGEGTLKEKLVELSKKLDIAHRIIFKGNVENINKAYLSSAIYAMSSRHEGMPLSLIEAMECGLPIVSFDCPCGPKEIINNTENGFLIKNMQSQSLAEKLLLLMHDSKIRMLMGIKAKDSAREFDKNKIMKKWEKLFYNVTGKIR